ncbi:MAG: carboxylating nicotinate-nucleotide diphosphorylase [Glaciecola sp.]
MIEQYAVNIKTDVENALREDLGGHIAIENDITAMLIPAEQHAHAHIITREDIVLCGVDWAKQAFSLIDKDVKQTWVYKDGDHIPANTTIVELSGSARSILCSERTALNFLQMLSGTATVTHFYTEFLNGSHTQLLDTRKTIPGFRQAQKYAVACAGATNHRIGLFDAYLIKENHIKACGTIAKAVAQAKSLHPQKKVEVEVESLKELGEAIAAGVDICMLDNFTTKLVEQAVALNNGQCKLEVSGNITEERLTELAKTGVDYVSTGAITKHVKAVDLSLLIK